MHSIWVVHTDCVVAPVKNNLHAFVAELSVSSYNAHVLGDDVQTWAAMHSLHQSAVQHATVRSQERC